MWENINKLRKKRGRETKEVKLYNENMEELDQNNVQAEMEGFWTTIYNKQPNRMNMTWNQEKRNECQQLKRTVKLEQEKIR